MTFFSLNFDLINTAELCGLDIRASTLGNDEVEACCPYCCDHRYRMYLIRLTNMFYCHNCGTGGNAVTLYSSFNPNGVTLKNYESYKRLFWPIDQKGIDDFMLFRKLKKEYEEKIKEEQNNDSKL